MSDGVGDFRHPKMRVERGRNNMTGFASKEMVKLYSVLLCHAFCVEEEAVTYKMTTSSIGLRRGRWDCRKSQSSMTDVQAL